MNCTHTKHEIAQYERLTCRLYRDAMIRPFDLLSESHDTMATEECQC